MTRQRIPVENRRQTTVITVPNHIISRLEMEDEKRGGNKKSKITSECLATFLPTIEHLDQASWDRLAADLLKGPTEGFDQVRSGRHRKPFEELSDRVSLSIPNYLIWRLTELDNRLGRLQKSRIIAAALASELADIDRVEDVYQKQMALYQRFSMSDHGR